jgi:hypothetical protein
MSDSDSSKPDLSNPNAHLLRDALSKETRDERRNLLLVSAVGLIVERTGLIPSKIEALGIEFNSLNQSSLLWIIAIFVGYFWFAFLTYSLTDFLAWRIIFRTTLEEFLNERLAQIKSQGAQSLLKETSPRTFLFLLKAVKPVSWIRIVIIEIGLPLIIGIVAIAFLVCHAAFLVPDDAIPPVKQTLI